MLFWSSTENRYSEFSAGTNCSIKIDNKLSSVFPLCDFMCSQKDNTFAGIHQKQKIRETGKNTIWLCYTLWFCTVYPWFFSILENKRGKKRGEAKKGTGKEATEGGGEAKAQRRGETKAKGGWKAKEALWKGDKDQGMT